MYERTEDGITACVTEAKGLAEGRAAMLDRVTLREHVRMISEEAGAYDITYKDDRHVILIPVDAVPEPTGEPVGEGDEDGEGDDSVCEGHSGDDDHDLLRGVGIGETTYCDGSCRPRRPRHPFAVMIGYSQARFADRGAAERCAAHYGSTVIAD
ncbi:hypothetical protein [Streptomyces sp. NPDC001068]|uniref:hypothetical protein n=1 Tax=Streptomyces sp. NPDC001068 TaxID=3364544 RepID=UPI003675DFB4